MEAKEVVDIQQSQFAAFKLIIAITTGLPEERQPLDMVVSPIGSVCVNSAECQSKRISMLMMRCLINGGTALYLQSAQGPSVYIDVALAAN